MKLTKSETNVPSRIKIGEENLPAVKFYCESCQEHKKVEIEPLSTDALNINRIWGDIICADCHFVIATISASEAGIYQLVKVAELPSAGDAQYAACDRWFVATEEEPDYDETKQECIFPNMTDKKNVALGKRSGLLF